MPVLDCASCNTCPAVLTLTSMVSDRLPELSSLLSTFGVVSQSMKSLESLDGSMEISLLMKYLPLSTTLEFTGNENSMKFTVLRFISRFVNNPDSVTGFAAYYGLALICGSLPVLGTALISQGINQIFLKFVEE